MLTTSYWPAETSVPLDEITVGDLLRRAAHVVVPQFDPALVLELIEAERGSMVLGRDGWAERFAGVDACVTPVLAPDEVLRASGRPGPVPRFSRTPGGRGPDAGQPDATAEVLAEAGLTEGELRAVAADAQRDGAFGFKWPPD